MKYIPNYRRTVPDTKEFYSAEEVALKLGVSVMTIYRHMKKGDIPFLAFGRRKLIEKVEYERWKKSFRKKLKEGLCFTDSKTKRL